MKKFFPFYKKMSLNNSSQEAVDQNNDNKEKVASVIANNNLSGSKTALDILSEVACNQDSNIEANSLLAEEISTNDSQIEKIDLSNLTQAQALKLSQILNSNNNNNQIILASNSMNSNATLDIESTANMVHVPSTSAVLQQHHLLMNNNNPMSDISTSNKSINNIVNIPDQSTMEKLSILIKESVARDQNQINDIDFTYKTKVDLLKKEYEDKLQILDLERFELISNLQNKIDENFSLLGNLVVEQQPPSMVQLTSQQVNLQAANDLINQSDLLKHMNLSDAEKANILASVTNNNGPVGSQAQNNTNSSYFNSNLPTSPTSTQLPYNFQNVLEMENNKIIKPNTLGFSPKGIASSNASSRSPMTPGRKNVDIFRSEDKNSSSSYGSSGISFNRNKNSSSNISINDTKWIQNHFQRSLGKEWNDIQNNINKKLTLKFSANNSKKSSKSNLSILSQSQTSLNLVNLKAPNTPTNGSNIKLEQNNERDRRLAGRSTSFTFKNRKLGGNYSNSRVERPKTLLTYSRINNAKPYNKNGKSHSSLNSYTDHNKYGGHHRLSLGSGLGSFSGLNSKTMSGSSSFIQQQIHNSSRISGKNSNNHPHISGLNLNLNELSGIVGNTINNNKNIIIVNNSESSKNLLYEPTSGRHRSGPMTGPASISIHEVSSNNNNNNFKNQILSIKNKQIFKQPHRNNSENNFQNITSLKSFGDETDKEVLTSTMEEKVPYIRREVSRDVILQKAEISDGSGLQITE